MSSSARVACFCPCLATCTCNIVFDTSNGCARKTLLYFHIACSINPFIITEGEGEDSDMYSE